MERADTKAWIVVTLEGATAAGIYNLSDGSDPLAELGDGSLWLYRTGVTFVGLAALLALLVVFPALGPGSARSGAPAPSGSDGRNPATDSARTNVTRAGIDRYIPFVRTARALRVTVVGEARPPGLLYFGHLMHHEAPKLRDDFLALSAAQEVAAVAQDLPGLARIAWAKYTLLKGSLYAWALGIIALLVSAFLPK